MAELGGEGEEREVVKEMKKPIQCYIGLHDWIYHHSVVFNDNGILQKRKCKWCGRVEGRSISGNKITGWY